MTVSAHPALSPGSPAVGYTHVVLLGAMGFIGGVHASILRRLGLKIIAVDTNGRTDHRNEVGSVDWSDTVVDICTPTATHTSCLAQMYALGARSFIVEKPASVDAESWRTQVSTMPDGHIFVVHNYLFSRAFQICCDMVNEPVEISTFFNKDRIVDDARGRGVGTDGQLAHVLQIEAPHQFAMALALVPDLRVLTSDHFNFGGRRATERDTPVAASVTLRNDAGQHAVLRTHLRKPLQRVLRVTEWDGRTVEAWFPTTKEQRAMVIERDVDGRATTVFDGRDDLLGMTLQSAVTSLWRGEVPWEASASFAESVLECIDDSLKAGRAGTGSAAPVLSARERYS